MLKKVITLVLLAVALGFSAPAWSYCEACAEAFDYMFATAKGEVVAKEIHLVKPDKFVEQVKSNEPLVVVDIRTPAEMYFFSSTLPGTLRIPLSELFQKANLDSIPTDKKVIILCKSGTRATAAGTALRYIGFDKVYILKGGIDALSKYMSPKSANKPLKKAPEAPKK